MNPNHVVNPMRTHKMISYEPIMVCKCMGIYIYLYIYMHYIKQLLFVNIPYTYYLLTGAHMDAWPPGQTAAVAGPKRLSSETYRRGKRPVEFDDQFIKRS